MDGLSGLEVLDRLMERGATQPIIMLSGHADVPAAVAALKKGAVDFFEKPSATTRWSIASLNSTR